MKKLLLQTLFIILTISVQAQYVFTNFDIYPGSGDSYPEYFIQHNGKLYFRAINAFGGMEVHSTDGTITGTQMLMDINNGPSWSNPRHFISFMGRLFFVAEDGIHGHEVWGSNGTTAGTNILKDIWVGRMASSAGLMTGAIGSMFFYANDSVHGFELWKSDGTPGGTVMVNDNAPGKGMGAQPQFFGYKEKVYYTGSDNGLHNWLWQSDGTAAGTKFVKGLRFSSEFFEYNGKMYFSAFDSGASEKQLWVSDGTYAGTQRLSKSTVVRPHFKPILYNGKLIFVGKDSATQNSAIYVSDGTDAGTKMIPNTQQNTAISFTSSHITYNGIIYLCAGDTAHGYELWRTDGTAAGTFMVKDIHPGIGFSSPAAFAVCRGKLYFKAKQDDTAGMQLFVTDGTAAGTKMLSPTAVPVPHALSRTSEIVAYKDTLYFQAGYDNNGWELWSVKDTGNVTTVTTVAIENGLDIFPNPSTGKFTVKVKDGSFNKPVISVYDLSGRQIYHKEHGGGLSTIGLQLSGVAKGIYNLTIQDGSKVYTQKIMIE